MRNHLSSRFCGNLQSLFQGIAIRNAARMDRQGKRTLWAKLAAVCLLAVCALAAQASGSGHVNINMTPSASTVARYSPVTLTVKVTGANVGDPVPTGTVDYMQDTHAWGIELGHVTLDATGTATLTTSALPLGLDSFVIQYNGDQNYPLTTQGFPDVVDVTGAENFGQQTVGTTSAAASIFFSFSSNQTFGSINILTQGVPNLDFGVPATPPNAAAVCTAKTYSAGDLCVVNVAFTPTAPGLREGAVVIKDASGNALFTVYVYGVGTGPLLRYNPGSAQTLYTGLNHPQAMVVDASSNIYIADTNNGVLRKFVPSGNSYNAPLSVGTWSNPTGVAVDGAGNLFVTDQGTGKLSEVPWNGSGYGTQVVISSSYSSPQDVAVDGSGNLYVISSATTISKLPWNGTGYGAATTFGSGLSGGQYSTDFVDASGNVYVADYNGNKLIKETYSGGSYTQTTLATGGGPDGVAVDPAGNVYVANYSGGSIQLLPYTGSGATGYGSAVTLTSNITLSGPEAIYLDGTGNIYIEDYNLNFVEKWSVTTLPTITFPTPTNVGSPDSTDDPRTVSIMNVGNAALDILTPSMGLNPSFSTGFTYNNSSTCPQLSPSTYTYTFAPNFSCTYAVDFKPTAVGTNAGSFVITDNFNTASSTTQSIALSGTGIASTPTVTSVSPASGPAAGGTSVTITGTNFTGATGVNFGGVAATSVTVISATSITATSPAGAVGAIDVTVTTPGGTSATSSADAYTYAAKPTVTSVSPNSGSTSGGTVVTITGTNFTGTTGVNFGSTAATNITVVSATSITATSPAGAVGAIDVTVATAGGTSATSTADQFTYIAPIYTVTVLTDDATGVAANCSNQSLSGATLDANCSLRDAIAAAAAQTPRITIRFASALTSSGAATITLTSGLTLPKYMTLLGPGANLLTISGGNGSFTVITDTTGQGGYLNGLTISGGNSPSNGGAMNISGQMYVNSCAFTNNKASSGGGIYVNPSGYLYIWSSTIANNTSSGNGGGILNAGTFTLDASTVSGNTSGNNGGGILNLSILSMSDDTLTSNSAYSTGGGIDNASGVSGNVTLANSIVVGNSTTINYADVTANYVDKGGNIVNWGSGSTSPSSGNLAPLGYYGGPLQTMPPLPGSAAICAGTVANAAAVGFSGDERGHTVPTTTYPTNPCVDAGAVQTAYTLGFTIQPSNTVAGAAISPAPSVQLKDNGSAIALPGAPVTMTAAAGTLSGTSATTSATGLATFSNLSIGSAQTGDALTATIAVGTGTMTATSNSFNVNPANPTATQVIATESLSVNQAASFTPVTGSGGTAPLSYSISPTLPTGLSISSATGAISGTSTSASSTTTYTVTVKDANNLTGTATFSMSVSSLAATLGVTASPASPQAVNTSVTFTAQLAGVSLTPAVPTGTVTFQINGSASSDCPAKAVSATGAATCTTSRLAAGANQTITATYAGDSNFTVAAAGTTSFTVSALAATLGVTASPSSSTTVNNTVTFTAQLAGVSLTPVAPSGTVTFAVNGSASPDCPAITVASSGKATCTTYSLHAGSNSITATYSGDVNFTVATAGTATQTVSPMVTTTVLNSTPNSWTTHWTVDHPVTLTATVAPSPAGTAYVPYSGSVTFTDYVGSITGCSSAVAVNTTTGVATCTATALIAGSHNVVATYAGDTNYNGSTSSTLSSTVDKAATTTVVTSSSTGNHSTVNDSVIFTATVAPNPVPGVVNELAISGTVAFYMDGSSTPISGCSSAMSSYSTSTGNATATCTTTTLTAAGSPHAIVARYAGDSNYNSSDNSSTPMSQTVSALATTIGVTASPSSSTNVNASVTFTAQLVGVALTPVAPSGTVTFSINGSSSPDCPAVTVNASGRATCTTSRLTATSDAIVATYAGDSNFTVASAGTAIQTVSALAATLGVTASPSSSTMVNDSVTFTAQLAGVSFTPLVPTGTVNFTAHGSTISGCGAVLVSAAGKATCTTSSLAAGSNPITATYAGDSNFTVASTGTMTQTVTATTTTTAAPASLSYSPSSQTVGLSATVSSGSGTVNVGTVTFSVFNGGTQVGAAVSSGTVTSGSASVTYTLPGGTAVGAYSIQAVYNASAPFATSSDNSHSLTISKATATVTLGSLAQTYNGSALSATAATTPSGLAVTYTYNGSSTVPIAAGNYTVVGTINDSNYTGTSSGTLVIGKAVLTITGPTATKVYGAANPSLNGTYSGQQNGDTFTVSGNTTATATSGVGSYPITPTATGTNLANYTVTPVNGSLTITKAVLTVTANNISITFGQTLPAYTASITGYVNGDTSSVVSGSASLTTSPTTPSAAGTYAITATPGSLTASNYTFSIVCGTLTISKAASGVSTILQTTPTPSGSVGTGVTVGYAVTVSDAAASSTGTPTGTVQFYNGTSTLGSPVTLVNGAAALSTVFTTAQAASITALYGGDGNFIGSTSAAFTESVVAPGYSVAANPTALTLTRGTAGSVTLTFTPYGNYQGAAAYSCTGLPAFTSCMFTPSTVTFSGNNAVQTVTMQIYTLAPQASPGATRSAMLWIPAMLLGMLLMVRRRKLAVATRGLLMLLMLACTALSMTGCGWGSYSTPTGNDSITVNVTATAAPGSSFTNLNQTATINIIVQ